MCEWPCSIASARSAALKPCRWLLWHRSVQGWGYAVCNSIYATKPGYAASQRRRKCIEQCFGWGKTIGQIRQVMVRGLEKVDQLFTLTMAAYNLTRLRSLGALRPQMA